MNSVRSWLHGTPVWLRVVIALALPVAVFGVYVRFAALQDVFCKSPDELAEMMPGLRLHSLPITNLRAPLRYNFVQSMFYSQHGLGDVSFYYLASGMLSAIGLPIAERALFSASGATNLALAVAGGVVGARVLGSAGTGWVFALLTLLSPFYVFVSRTGWGRLTWTPFLLLVLFLGQWKAMRERSPWWSALFIGLAGFLSLTDGVVFLPLIGVLALFVPSGRLGERLRHLAQDRILVAAVIAVLLGAGVGLIAALEARRRGTNLTLMAYLLFKGTSGGVMPTGAALTGWQHAVDWYFPFRGAWIGVTLACVLAGLRGLRGHRIGFVAAWWLLASTGVLRYASGPDPDPSWLNAYALAVPSFLLAAWLVAAIADRQLWILRRVPSWMCGVLSMALLLGLLWPMAVQANTVAFSTTPAHGITMVSSDGMPRLSACRALKAASFYVRSHSTGPPYVFHLSSDPSLGHIGEFYYGLSYGRSLRPEDPNHLLDFGLQQFHRRHSPEAFYRAYGVEHFDYYIDFVDDEDPLKESAVNRLSHAGARVVCTIWNDGRPIGRILSFRDEKMTDLDYRTAAAAWDRTFTNPRTLLQQVPAGTAYHFGYNWRTPE